MNDSRSLFKSLGSCLGATGVVLWVFAGSCTASDVPYVPTPQSTVDDMLTLAGVGEGDVLYDLGSGDGRFVITAAEMGASGVGIDINPDRIREGNENAELAGVEDRVVFYQQDLFEAYIGDATVVTLYLLPSVNLKLRPKLLEELQPGTRVVSYSFDMGSWQPDRELGNGRNIYFWIIPANMTGTWRWSGPDGNHYEMEVEQDFQQISGRIRSGGDSLEIGNAGLTGDLIEFEMEQERGGNMERVIYRGRFANGIIEGSEERMDGSFPWEARRDPGTERVLDDGGETGFTSLPTFFAYR